MQFPLSIRFSTIPLLLLLACRPSNDRQPVANPALQQNVVPIARSNEIPYSDYSWTPGAPLVKAPPGTTQQKATLVLTGDKTEKIIQFPPGASIRLRTSDFLLIHYADHRQSAFISDGIDKVDIASGNVFPVLRGIVAEFAQPQPEVIIGTRKLFQKWGSEEEQLYELFIVSVDSTGKVTKRVLATGTDLPDENHYNEVVAKQVSKQYRVKDKVFYYRTESGILRQTTIP